MRKKSAANRDSRLVMRVYYLEKRAIELAAQKSGLTFSEYLRRAALNQPLYYRLTKDELRLYELLVEYRRNFSRISNLIRVHKDFTPDLEEVINAIDQQLQKFNT